MRKKKKMTYVMAPQAKKSVMTLSLVKDPSRKLRSSSSFHVKSCFLVSCHPIIYLTFAFVPLQIAFSQHNSIMDLVQFFVTFFRWVLVPSLFSPPFQSSDVTQKLIATASFSCYTSVFIDSLSGLDSSAHDVSHAFSLWIHESLLKKLFRPRGSET